MRLLQLCAYHYFPLRLNILSTLIVKSLMNTYLPRTTSKDVPWSWFSGKTLAASNRLGDGFPKGEGIPAYAKFMCAGGDGGLPDIEPLAVLHRLPEDAQIMLVDVPAENRLWRCVPHGKTRSCFAVCWPLLGQDRLPQPVCGQIPAQCL